MCGPANPQSSVEADIPPEVQSFAVGQTLTAVGFTIYTAHFEHGASVRTATHENVDCDLCKTQGTACKLPIDKIRWCPIGAEWNSPYGSVYQPACLNWQTANPLVKEGKHIPSKSRVLHTGENGTLPHKKLNRLQVKIVKARELEGSRGPCPKPIPQSDSSQSPAKRPRLSSTPLDRSSSGLRDESGPPMSDLGRVPNQTPAPTARIPTPPVAGPSAATGHIEASPRYGIGQQDGGTKRMELDNDATNSPHGNVSSVDGALGDHDPADRIDAQSAYKWDSSEDDKDEIAALAIYVEQETRRIVERSEREAVEGQEEKVSNLKATIKGLREALAEKDARIAALQSEIERFRNWAGAMPPALFPASLP